MNNIITNIEFAHPYAMAILLILPCIIYSPIKPSTRHIATLSLSTTAVFTSGKRGLKSRLFPLLFILRCLAIFAVIIALSEPKIKKTRSKVYFEGEGIDIILCIDVSASMFAEDFLPNRLEVLKKKSTKFIRTRSQDKIGIVVFDTIGFTICPLTTDTGILIRQLQSIRKQDFTKQGTSVTAGILTTINRLKKSRSKNKVILLFSDGVSNADVIPVDTAISIAVNHNIKIYTIGIGVDRKVPMSYIHKMNSEGDIIDEIKDSFNYGFNEPLLKMISKKTKGKYFYAEDRNNLDQIYNLISKLEKSKIEKKTQFIYFYMQYYFLMLAAVCIFLELLLRYSILKKFP